jgi:RHS repeat-associated protein
MYLVDGNNHTGYAQILEQLNANGGPPSSGYIIGDDVLGQCGGPGSDPRWLLYDGHGSTRQVVDGGYATKAQYNYDAYGVTQDSSVNTAETTLRYCGEQYDDLLKMYNLRARYYNPANGRFNERDSFQGNNFDPQSLHKYAYSNCDPINGADPTGQFTLVEMLILTAVLAIVVGLLLFAARKQIKAQIRTWNSDLATEAELNQIAKGLLTVRDLASPDPACQPIVEKIDSLLDHMTITDDSDPRLQKHSESHTGGLTIRVLHRGVGGMHRVDVKNVLFIPRWPFNTNDNGWCLGMFTLGEYQHDTLCPDSTYDEDKAQAQIDVLLNSIRRRYPNTNLMLGFKHGKQ